MKKFLSGLALALLVACSNGGPTTPDLPETAAPAPAPVAAATPAPQPVNDPPPTTPQHDARVKGGFYSVTNTTGIPQFYCAAAFGVLPGGEQGAGTNLYEDQGIRQNKDVFSGQAPKTAACQYKQIQVDLTQSKDCKNFDWHNVLAAEVYDNPGYIPGSEKEKLEALAYGEWGEWGSWSQESCGTRKRSRDVFEQYKYKCSGEVVKVKVRVEEQTETKECCKYPEPSFTISINDPVYTPAQSAVAATQFYYNYSNSGQNSGGGRWTCEYYNGTWIGNLAGVGQHVCAFSSYKGATIGVFTIGTYHSNNGKAAVAEALGPITTTATFSGAGTWLLRMNATGYTDGQKGQKQEVLTCNSEPKTISVTYDWFNHGSEQWWGNLRLNGGVVATSEIRNNPSN